MTPDFIIIRDTTPAAAIPKGTVVAMGNFDGVHLGHRAVIQLHNHFVSVLQLLKHGSKVGRHLGFGHVDPFHPLMILLPDHCQPRRDGDLARINPTYALCRQPRMKPRPHGSVAGSRSILPSPAYCSFTLITLLPLKVTKVILPGAWP